MPSPVYIAEIRISDAIEQKIREKHNVTGDEVREALILRRDVRAAWEHDPQRGSRVLALGHTYQRRLIFAALYPVDPQDGVWNLGTARSPRVTNA